MTIPNSAPRHRRAIAFGPFAIALTPYLYTRLPFTRGTIAPVRTTYCS
jgi:hypothetical protein